MESTNIKETKNALHVLRAQDKYGSSKNTLLKRLEKRGDIVILVKGKELADYLKRPIMLNLPQYKEFKVIRTPVIVDDRTLIGLLQDNLTEIFELKKSLRETKNLLKEEKKMSSSFEGMLEEHAESYEIASGKARAYDKLMEERKEEELATLNLSKSKAFFKFLKFW